MKTSLALILTAALFALVDRSASAQDQPKVVRIGLLLAGGTARANLRGNSTAFLLGLQELGYVEGKNLIIERRNAKGNPALLPELAAELARLNVAVIVAAGPTAVDSAMKATKTIPIVMPNGGDPIARGFVKNLIRPGGNVTGISTRLEGMQKKQIELLKETIPEAKHLVMLVPRVRSRTIAEDYMEKAAVAGIDVQSVDFFKPDDFDGALAKIITLHPDALLTVQNTLTLRYARQLAAFASKHRLPLITNDRRFTEAGALISLGVNYMVNFRRAAVIVDKILKGANPATLPVEPPHLEMVVNLKTAEKLGIKIPPQILLEANEVIR